MSSSYPPHPLKLSDPASLAFLIRYLPANGGEQGIAGTSKQLRVVQAEDKRLIYNDTGIQGGDRKT